MKKMFFLTGFIAVLCLFPLSAQAFDSSPIGWASEGGGTTGGAGGTEVTVDNADDFIYYCEDTDQDPYIIYVSGHITLSNNVRVRGNKTIIGLPGSHITGNLKCYRAEESNNIFRFLSMDNAIEVGDKDCISIDGAQHIWIDHCTFTDGGDGNVDIKNGADYVTVSWCIFKYTFDSGHNYTNLVGHSDSNGGTDRGHLRVTFHHNWWSTMCKERMPRVRFGQVHVYNNYYSDLLAGGYCVGVGTEANIRVENNYFNAVSNTWANYYGSYTAGIIGWNSGNVFDECSAATWAPNDYDTVFTPTYAYTLDDAEDIPALVQYGAGVNGQDGTPPHWFFGMYGDFDLSGFVDMNDFAEFANYWKADVADCNLLYDVDHDGDCEVDFYELALLAENWLYIPPDITPPDAPTGLGALADDSIVSLDWNDNSEEDLAGYSIYRSTTSGSGYTKLNTPLLTDSNYTDNAVTNNTTYYYIVTATDTNSNESDYSNEVSAYPSAGGASLTIQEDTAGFCGVDGKVEDEWSGYTGTGYANTDNAIGNGVDWSVNILTAGNYTFTWRYASASGDRAANLLVNGSPVVSGISFPSTGAWTTWTTVSTGDVALTAGVKTIRLQATTGDGLANIDYISIAGANLMPASCP
ncbi:MAG: carbohydrate-binding protein [Phycisphaerae bacterium]|nr:carbohydrate-binding protein [Phycisphaerae bacterium]